MAPALRDSPQTDKSTLDRLFDSAAALFWEKGYAAATTREIAALVGIQQASLYYHVASKEDLLYQLGVSSLRQLHLTVQAEVGRAGDPLERIRIFIPAHLRTLLQHQIRHVTVLTELHGLSAAHRSDVLALRRQYASFVRGLLEGAQRSGQLRDDVPAQYLYLALLNMLNWAVFWFRRDRQTPVDEVAAAFSDIFLDGAMVANRRSTHRLSLPKGARKRASKNPRRSTASTPERMLARAAALFASKGYSATSTREIAAGLGMRKASLYYHIQTKQDLLHIICKSSLEQIQSEVDEALRGAKGAAERVRTLISTHIQSMLRDQDKHAAALAEMHLLSPDRQAEIVALRDAYDDQVREVLEDARRNGVLRTDIPLDYVALGLLGLVNRVAVWYRPGGSLAPDQLARLFAELYLTGARAPD